ncbi:MAG: hypothetical protein AAF193_09540, partial [Bacteroidota bacterium]
MVGIGISDIGAQTLLYEDSFEGGVTAGGFGQEISGTSDGTIEIQISPGSTIRQAWLLVGRLGDAPDVSFTFGNFNLDLNATNQLSESFDVPNYGGISGVHGFDVTDMVDPSTNFYPISIPAQNDVSNRYQSFYLFVAFDNNLLGLVHTALYLNEDDASDDQVFQLGDLVPLPDEEDIVVSSFCSYACSANGDAQVMVVNGTNVGAMGNADLGSASCSSVIGSYHYADGTATGLNDDTVDGVVNEGDGLVEISDYSNPGDTDLELVFFDGPNPSTDPDNIQWAVSLTYGDACEFPEHSVSEDQTICPGQEIILWAEGAETVTWSLDGEDLVSEELMVSPEISTDYSVLMEFEGGCFREYQVEVEVNPIANPFSL